LLLQNFDFHAYDPEYKLQIRKTLTVKPLDFFMTARLRHGLDPVVLEHQLWNSGNGANKVLLKDSVAESVGISSSTSLERRPMHIYYGSNTGTCQALAHSLASEASIHGFNAIVDSLDTATKQFPRNVPIAIIVASYEGEPPDNASVFVEWLKTLEESALTGANHVVFGCGNST